MLINGLVKVKIWYKIVKKLIFLFIISQSELILDKNNGVPKIMR